MIPIISKRKKRIARMIAAISPAVKPLDSPPVAAPVLGAIRKREHLQDC